MTFTNNDIFFRRASKVVVDTYDYRSDNRNFAEVATLDANLRTLGYALSGDLAYALIHTPVNDIKAIHDTIVREAKEIKGVRRYRPMYPNFPKQVMEASEAELRLNAIMHYFGTTVGLRILPVYDDLKRPDLNFDESKVTVVGLGSRLDFADFIANLMSSKSAFSETDKADLESLEGTSYGYALSGVEAFENRENKAWLTNQSLVRGLNIEKFTFDTATDVLRLAVAMSGGDISLAETTRFRSFKRPERRMLISLLAKVNDPAEDMLRHASMWKRLGERLHPGEFGMAEVFKAVRENNSVETFNSKVEKAITEGNPLAAVKILEARPGEFARRLDKVLRTNAPVDVQREIIGIFAKVADKASPTVLLQARNAFINRKDSDIRVFFPKGSVAKMQSQVDQREPLRKEIVNEVISVLDAALYANFRSRGDLGGSYVDPALKGVAVPLGLRNASKQVHSFGRGSRLSLGEDSNVVRFFIWWKDAADGGWGYRPHTDIDLSAVCYDGHFDYHSNVTYYNLRESGAVHSGDITSAPDGASEFIDIDIDTLRARGVRYVAMTLHSYSGQNFVELPECFAGFMERRDLGSGEIYDPRTVTNKADLTAKSRGATPFIFDLETREAIWVDLSMNVGSIGANVANSKGQITSVVEAMASLTPPSLYDLFTIHAASRGGIVTKEDANTVFSFDGDVTPFDTEKILSEYL